METMCKSCINYDDCQHDEIQMDECLIRDGYMYEEIEDNTDGSNRV